MKKSGEPAADSAGSTESNLDLEFPNWSGMDDSPARITPEAAFRLCENYPAWASKTQARRREDEREKFTGEFIL